MYCHGDMVKNKITFMFVYVRYYLLVSCGANIDTPRMAPRFKLAGQCHIVPKQAIAWHFNPNNTCQHRTCVDTNP